MKFNSSRIMNLYPHYFNIIMSRFAKGIAATVLLVSIAACERRRSPEIDSPRAKNRGAAAEVASIADGKLVTGRTIYVPAYSSIYVSDRAANFNLAITLSVRNADPERSITIIDARYFDHDGKLVHDYIDKPIRLGPLGSIEYFVKENDTSGGVSASFLVDWAAESETIPPVVEAVMIGTKGTQTVSFTTSGRPIPNRRNESRESTR